MRSIKFGKPTIVEGLEGPRYQPFQYSNVWELKQTSGPQRLVIAPAEGHVELMLKLNEKMSGPFGILYVLLLSRLNKAKPGRYQSLGLMDRAAMEGFMREFGGYFEGDGRHHVWIASPADGSTLVYDQHNFIYAYGPLDDFRQVLQLEGLKQGQVTIPAPHFHAYNREMDGEEERLLKWWDWEWSPLRKGDEWD